MMIKRCKQCGQAFYAKRKARDYCSRDCSNKDRWKRFSEGGKNYQVLSCGGGVQSTAMIVLIANGKLPMPDLVIMVDAGYEKESTIKYANDVLTPLCNKIGLEFKYLKTEPGFLFNSSGMLIIPAYKRMPNGQIQKLYTMCNDKWKLNPIKREIRGRGIAQATCWIGISTDEAQRQRQSRYKWISNKYPLVELGLSRYQCLFEIRKLGLPDPPRTSCIMCPLQIDEEWEKMKSESPNDYNRCIQIENDIQIRNPNIFLHKSTVRLEDIFWQCDVTVRG